MSAELKVPTLGESITEATVSKWLKKVGEPFEVDDLLVEIETDKITVEVPAPSAGELSEIKAEEGTDIKIGGILGVIVDAKGAVPVSKKEEKKAENDESKEESSPKKEKNPSSEEEQEPLQNKSDSPKLSPSVKKMIEENNLDASKIKTQRADGRLTKEDVQNYISSSANSKLPSSGEREEVVRMSRIRRMIATRLKEAQNTAAILTTFNEVDMTEIMKVRELKKDDFMDHYGVKLGFMSFFVKAVVMSLQEFSAVNAEIRDENIVYKNHFDIGIAVGTEKGLVVPVLKKS